MRDLNFVAEVVEHFNKNESTVRKTAEHFGISKSTVYTYLTLVMPNQKSEAILKINKEQRHIRGGQATKNKFLRKKRS